MADGIQMYAQLVRAAGDRLQLQSAAWRSGSTRLDSTGTVSSEGLPISASIFCRGRLGQSDSDQGRSMSPWFEAGQPATTAT